MKNKVIIVLCFVLLFVFCVSAQSPHVVDDADLLSQQEYIALEEKANSLSDTYQLDIVILTVDSIGEKSAQDFADDYYDNNNYGVGPSYSGILLLISMEYRDFAFSTCGNAIDILDDSSFDSLEAAMLPHLASERYYSGFQAYLNQLETTLENHASQNTLTVEKVLLRLLIAFVIGAGVAGIVLLIMRGCMNTAKQQSGASGYLKDNSFDLFRCQDLYLYSRTSRVRKDSGSSGSSTHRSSSGRSHGGRSGKF